MTPTRRTANLRSSANLNPNNNTRKKEILDGFSSRSPCRMHKLRLRQAMSQRKKEEFVPLSIPPLPPEFRSNSVLVLLALCAEWNRHLLCHAVLYEYVLLHHSWTLPDMPKSRSDSRPPTKLRKRLPPHTATQTLRIPRPTFRLSRTSSILSGRTALLSTSPSISPPPSASPLLGPLKPKRRRSFTPPTMSLPTLTRRGLPAWRFLWRV